MAWIKLHKKLLVVPAALGVALLGIVVGIYFFVGGYSKYVSDAATLKNKDVRVGIVFGSGITSDGKPFKELQGRLDAAAKAIDDGTVDVLLLSGDNRFVNYNEPEAMLRYLKEKGVDATILQADYAGRSTYETCERAAKVFTVDRAILFSAPSHLPRAIYTCRMFGIESYGIAAGNDANNAFRRELLARSKAIFNIYLLGEKTVLGAKIPL